MKQLKEQNLSKEEISLLRDNISFISNNIHEGFIDTIRSLGSRAASTIGREVMKSVQRGIEADIEETSAAQRSMELNRASEHLNMDPKDLLKWRIRAKDFIHPTTGVLTPPKKPRPGASYAEKARYEADLKDHDRVKDILTRTALLRERNPQYRQLLQTHDMQTTLGAETLAGKGLMGRLLKIARDYNRPTP